MQDISSRLRQAEEVSLKLFIVRKIKVPLNILDLK